MLRCDDAVVEVEDLLEESWEDPRRRRQSALAGSVNQANPEPGWDWSGSQASPGSWSSDPKKRSPATV